jgi:hypothetical protein
MEGGPYEQRPSAPRFKADESLQIREDPKLED